MRKNNGRLPLLLSFLVCLSLLAGGFPVTPAKANNDLGTYIKFQGSLWATDYDITEPAGVGAWKQANPDNPVIQSIPEYYAFGRLGKAAPRTGQSVGIQGFSTLAGIDPANIEIEVMDMQLNQEETYHTGDIDPTNIRFHELWENGTAILRANGQEIARSVNMELTASNRVTRDNQWVNEIEDFQAVGELEPIPDSQISQDFVSEFETIFGTRSFQLLFQPMDGHADLGIAANPLQNSSDYVFNYTTLFTGVPADPINDPPEDPIDEFNPDHNGDGIVDLFDIVLVAKNRPELIPQIAAHYGKRPCGLWILDAKVPVDHVKSIQVESDLHVVENTGTVSVNAYAPNGDTHFGSGTCRTYVGVYDALRTSDPASGGIRLEGAIADLPVFASETEATVSINTNALPAGEYWLRFTTKLPDGTWEVAEGVLMVHE